MTWFGKQAATVAMALLGPMAALPTGAAADGLQPERMMDCVAREADHVFDALAGRPDLHDSDPAGVAAAFGESFANCSDRADGWLACFDAADPLACLTGMAESAEGAVALERAAALLLVEDGTGDRARIDSGDRALEAYRAGLGREYLSGCLGNPPGGVPEAQHELTCRILDRLKRYAAFAGGMRLHEAMTGLPDRAAAGFAMPTDAACTAAAEADLAAALGGGDDVPMAQVVAFFDCADLSAVADRCAEGGRACLEAAWRDTRAARIAAELSYAGGPGAPAPKVSPDLVAAVSDIWMRECFPPEQAGSPGAEVYFLLCRMSTDAGGIAALDGLARVAGQAAAKGE